MQLESTIPSVLSFGPGEYSVLSSNGSDRYDVVRQPDGSLRCGCPRYHYVVSRRGGSCRHMSEIALYSAEQATREAAERLTTERAKMARLAAALSLVAGKDEAAVIADLETKAGEDAYTRGLATFRAQSVHGDGREFVDPDSGAIFCGRCEHDVDDAGGCWCDEEER